MDILLLLNNEVCENCCSLVIALKMVATAKGILQSHAINQVIEQLKLDLCLNPVSISICRS